MAADCNTSVLWKCDSCDICFVDLTMFENHKCVASAEHATISGTCMKELEVHSYVTEGDVSNENEDQETTIHCLNAIADGESNHTDASMTLVSSVPCESPRSALMLSGTLSIKRETNKRQKSKRSHVWLYFSALDEKKALCCLCSKVIAYCGTPTNLVYHLSRFHPQESDIVKSKQKGLKYQYLDNKLPKPSLSACSATIIKSAELQSAAAAAASTATSSSSSSSTSTSKKMSLVDRLVEMLMIDLMPATLLQGEGFRKFISSIDPSVKLPEPKKILHELIPKKYYLEFKKIQLFVQGAEKIHLSVDLWIGFGEDYFATFTSHFITPHYENKSYILCTTRMGSDPNQALVTDLLCCISNWELTKKVVCIVTNGSEKIAKTNFQSGWKHVVCFANTLNTIITESLSSSPAMTALLEKCRAVVAFLRENETASQTLRDIQTRNKQMQLHVERTVESVEIKAFPLKPKKDIPTHWISMFYMMQRIFTLKNIIHVVFETVALPVEPLDDEDWTSIEEIISLLKAFEVVTLELCSESYPSLAKVIPIVHGLLSLVDNCSTLTVKAVEKVRRDLLAKLRKRVGQVENNLTYAMTTVLDPRFKNIAFQSEKAVENVIALLCTEGCKHAKEVLQSSAEQDVNHEASYTDSLWEGFDKKATPKKKPVSATETVNLEINRYLEEPLIDRKRNPLNWWKDYGSARFPVLSVVAREFLSIPATSVPPERVFLLKGQAFCDKKKKIKPKYIDQFLFLNKNIV